jgi:hypothetical protein
VFFSAQAEELLAERQGAYPQLRRLITESLALDPRPAYQGATGKSSRGGVRFYHFDVRFAVEAGELLVVEIVEAGSDGVA